MNLIVDYHSMKPPIPLVCKERLAQIHFQTFKLSNFKNLKTFKFSNFPPCLRNSIKPFKVGWETLLHSTYVPVKHISNGCHFRVRDQISKKMAEFSWIFYPLLVLAISWLSLQQSRQVCLFNLNYSKLEV